MRAGTPKTYQHTSIMTYLGWRYEQNGVDHEDFIVFLTRVILKSPGTSEPLCRGRARL